MSIFDLLGDSSIRFPRILDGDIPDCFPTIKDSPEIWDSDLENDIPTKDDY